QSEQNRRHQANRGVARQQADDKGGYGHRRDGEDQRYSSAVAIADVADDGAAQGPHQVANGEHAERRQHLGYRILAGKEGAANRGGEVAVDGKVVPFEHVADGAGGDDARSAGSCCHRTTMADAAWTSRSSEDHAMPSPLFDLTGKVAIVTGS